MIGKLHYKHFILTQSIRLSRKEGFNQKGTLNSRSTRIQILWTPGLPQVQNHEGCKTHACADCGMTQHDVKHLRLGSPPDENDTVRFMEQTHGCCPGTQLSQVSDPDCNEHGLKGEQQHLNVNSLTIEWKRCHLLTNNIECTNSPSLVISAQKYNTLANEKMTNFIWIH